MRTHVIIPDHLVEAVDRLVGKRHRSAFFSQAVAERLRREELLFTLKKSAGILKEKEYPHWATARKSAHWVRKVRRESEPKRKSRGRVSS